MSRDPRLVRPSWRGRTNVDALTIAALEHAEQIGGHKFTVTQGSYQGGRGEVNSAGTHDGGGAVDINVGSWSSSTRNRVVLALRKAGFAAWLRTPSDGFAYHIHAVAIGDREMSSGAKSQIQQWREDTNGLANHAHDPYPDPYPAWTAKYR